MRSSEAGCRPTSGGVRDGTPPRRAVLALGLVGGLLLGAGAAGAGDPALAAPAPVLCTRNDHDIDAFLAQIRAERDALAALLAASARARATAMLAAAGDAPSPAPSRAELAARLAECERELADVTREHSALVDRYGAVVLRLAERDREVAAIASDRDQREAARRVTAEALHGLRDIVCDIANGADDLAAAPKLLVAADVNAVPPLGSDARYWAFVITESRGFSARGSFTTSSLNGSTSALAMRST